jgi:hypothetical protein
MQAILLSAAVVGCRSPKHIHYLGEAELQHYHNQALSVQYPNVMQETPAEVVYSQRPRTVKDLVEDEVWDMTLVEAVHTAVANNKMIRTRVAIERLPVWKPRC